MPTPHISHAGVLRMKCGQEALEGNPTCLLPANLATLWEAPLSLHGCVPSEDLRVGREAISSCIIDFFSLERVS